jgi:class 3 adenylate cyclase
VSGRARELRYRWEWDLEAAPEVLWPLVADTNRFNRDAGVPAIEERGLGANARRRLRLTKLGVPVEWEEEPFEWVRPHRFSVVRRYAKGPLREMRVSADLQPLPSGGTRLVYDVAAEPRNAVGRIAAPVEIGRLSARRFEDTFRRYDRLAQAGSALDGQMERPRLAPGAARRLEAATERLHGAGLEAGLVERLARLLAEGDELTLSRLRPYILADYWGAERRAVLELFLHATRAGLLELRWDVLCPLCRGSAESASALTELEAHAHCETCALDFDASFDRSVELSFRPSSSIREVASQQFCVAGPQITPHVVAQQLLAPRAERSLDLQVEPGRYRVRARGVAGAQALAASQSGAAEAVARLNDAGWSADELRLATDGSLRLVNATGEERLVVLERTAWADDAVTAAEVTALQVFRDLFSTEALRPGEEISVGSLTFVFTDLRDSTRFYREVGDAPAFGSVMDHLDTLSAAVAREEGAVVKAMGDAIMAVFTRPVAAVRAALAAQQELASPPAGKRPLLLKAGVHAGPCIAVTQNGRLDYFGSTVNLAARLVGLSTGQDVVLSDEVLSDPEVADEFAHGAEAFEASVKGFDEDRFKLWRLAAPAVPSRSG